MKRIVVTGGRNYSDVSFVHSVLNKILQKESFILIHGNASGLDSICRDWAIENKIQEIPFPANRNDLSPPCKIRYKSGKPYNVLAGFKRNEEMIVKGKPHLCLAFEGGNGTNDMIDRYKKHKIPTFLQRAPECS